MTKLTIDLPNELLNRLAEEAERRYTSDTQHDPESMIVCEALYAWYALPALVEMANALLHWPTRPKGG